jgi:hypothetical protein
VYKDENIGGFAFNLVPKEYSGSDRFINEQTIHQIIPGARVRIEPFNSSQVAAELGIPSLQVNHLHPNMINSAAMYMGISRGFRMALEDAESPLFTHFLRIRPDFQIDARIVESDLASDFYFCGPVVDTGYGMVSDQCFFLRSQYAIDLANLESKIRTHVGENGWGVDSSLPFYGERILAFFLLGINGGLNARYSPSIGSIKRPVIVEVRSRNRVSWGIELVKYNFSVLRNRMKYTLKRVLRHFT